MLLSLQTPAERPQNIFVEFKDGRELPVEKIYYIGGKSKTFKVLISDENKAKDDALIEDLKHDYKILQEEEKDAQREINRLEEELEKRSGKHEEYLQKIDNALETAELDLKIETSARHCYDRIAELAEKIAAKFDSMEEERESFKEKIRLLEVENKALAWNIEQLTAKQP